MTRRQRKTRWIREKNLWRKYPECVHGDFYTNHIIDPKDREKQYGPCVWIDFTFFHTKLKRYFSVAAQTLEYSLYCENEERADEELNKTHPYPDVGLIFHPIDPKTGLGRIEITAEHTAVYNAREPLKQKLLSELNSEAQKARPKIVVKDYGEVAVGLWVTLDVPHFDANIINNFIKFYRSIGEPITPGFEWEGEEVDVVPERFTQRHAGP